MGHSQNLHHVSTGITLGGKEEKIERELGNIGTAYIHQEGFLKIIIYPCKRLSNCTEQNFEPGRCALQNNWGNLEQNQNLWHTIPLAPQKHPYFSFLVVIASVERKREREELYLRDLLDLGRLLVGLLQLREILLIHVVSNRFVFVVI